MLAFLLLASLFPFLCALPVCLLCLLRLLGLVGIVCSMTCWVACLFALLSSLHACCPDWLAGLLLCVTVCWRACLLAVFASTYAHVTEYNHQPSAYNMSSSHCAFSPQYITGNSSSKPSSENGPLYLRFSKLHVDKKKHVAGHEHLQMPVFIMSGTSLADR